MGFGKAQLLTGISTSRLVLKCTFLDLLSTRDTVAVETPALLATSLIVIRLFFMSDTPG